MTDPLHSAFRRWQRQPGAPHRPNALKSTYTAGWIAAAGDIAPVLAAARRVVGEFATARNVGATLGSLADLERVLASYDGHPGEPTRLLDDYVAPNGAERES